MIDSSIAALSKKQQDRLADAAELYWVRGLKVDAVARELRTSRSTASRLIAQARREHVVEFVVHRTLNSAPELVGHLEKKFHIHAAVVDAGDKVDIPMQQLAVGKTSAIWLDALLKPNMSVGVAWGRTVEALSLQLPRRQVPNLDVVQLHGFGDSPLFGENYVTQILARFRDSIGASVHILPLPAILILKTLAN